MSLKPSHHRTTFSVRCPKRYAFLLKVLRYIMVGVWVLIVLYVLGRLSLRNSDDMNADASQNIVQNVATGLSYHLYHKNKNLVAKSPKATMRPDKSVDLEGPVTLSVDDGTQLVTDRAHLNPQTKSLSGDRPIKGAGPSGTLQANAFAIEDGGDTLTLKGDAELEFYEREK